MYYTEQLLLACCSQVHMDMVFANPCCGCAAGYASFCCLLSVDGSVSSKNGSLSSMHEVRVSYDCVSRSQAGTSMQQPNSGLPDVVLLTPQQQGPERLPPCTAMTGQCTRKVQLASC